MSIKVYHYLGDIDRNDLFVQSSNRHQVTSGDKVVQWMNHTQQPKNPDGTVTITYIIDTSENLWINDRHSEHVLCAQGQDVLSAGEMTFEWRDGQMTIVDVTNQSTGYCPQPESYHAVKVALQCTDIDYPDTLTTAYQFRRCDTCHSINIIKDDWYICAVCDAELNIGWNF